MTACDRLVWLLPAAAVLVGCGAAQDGALNPAAVSPSATATPRPGPKTDPLFNQDVLHEVRLVMDAEQWQALRDNYRENQYYAADIVIDGARVQQVGVRSRGDGSRDRDKPGLKVDFNKYVPAQEFHGYKSLVLDNIAQDRSMLRERLAYAAFEAMGIPAPQIAHGRLSVNDEYWGLYALVEPISKPFLKNRLGEESGNLFDYEYFFEWDFSILGNRPEDYIPRPFQPQTNEEKLDGKALVDFVRAANDAPTAGFAAAMAKYIDVERFLTYVAVENALAERDGFVGQYGMNNFYLYQYGDSTRFTVIPWDKDTGFNQAGWPANFNIHTNVLVDKLVADGGLRKVYDEAVVRAVRTAVNERFLAPRLDAAYQQIRESARTDAHKPYTNAQFEGDVEFVRSVITSREADIAAQLPGR